MWRSSVERAAAPMPERTGAPAPPSPACGAASRFISIKRAAFQIFVAKLRPTSNFFMSTLESQSSEVMSASEKRSASAEYSSMILSGSRELPSDFDILRPCASRTMPWMTMFANGGFFMKWMPAIIMRATQKKMMSCAVTRSVVG